LVSTSEDKPRISYALVIWPIESLPSSLRKFVANSIEEIAREADCDLKKLLVQEDQLQLLVELPPKQPSSWFAKLVKDGVKQKIQSQFGLSLELWASGFYASQSDQPLSDTELSLLKRSQ
jgi:REP element-mobilizing transposase RayT